MENMNRNANSNRKQNKEGFPGDMHNFYFTNNHHANFNLYIATPPPPNPTPTFAPPNIFQQSGFPNSKLMGFQADRMPMPSSMNTTSNLFQVSPQNSGAFGHHHHDHSHDSGSSAPASAGLSTSGGGTASTTSGVSSGRHSPDCGDQRPQEQDEQGTFEFHPDHPGPGCICQFRLPLPQPQPAFGNGAAANRYLGTEWELPIPSSTLPGGIGGMGPASLPRSSSSFSTGFNTAFMGTSPHSPGSAPSQGDSPS